MLSRPRNALLFAIVLSLVAGFAVTGHYLYKAPIGLDPSAFLLGDWIQSLAPGAAHAIAGPVWALGSLVVVAGISVWLLRRATSRSVDSARRSFLARAGSSAGMALGSIASRAICSPSSPPIRPVPSTMSETFHPVRPSRR